MSAPVKVDGADAIEARMSARLVTDFDPGTPTVALTGPRAVGAGQGSGVSRACEANVVIESSVVGHVRHPGDMCGRYVARNDVQALRSEFSITRVTEQVLPANYNTAPTQQVYIIVDTDTEEDGFQRRLDVARWGLVPSWAKDPAIGSRMINARAETVADKPAYRSSFARRRCLVPVTGFYEWQAASSGPKQPYFLHSSSENDGIDDVGLAGLYSWWRDPAVMDGDDPHAWMLTMTIMTTAADAWTARIHERMPIPIPIEQRSAWLDPHSAGSDVLAEVVAALPEHCWTGYPVSRAVNNVRTNGPHLLEPAEVPEAREVRE